MDRDMTLKREKEMWLVLEIREAHDDAMRRKKESWLFRLLLLQSLSSFSPSILFFSIIRTGIPFYSFLPLTLLP